MVKIKEEISCNLGFSISELKIFGYKNIKMISDLVDSILGNDELLKGKRKKIKNELNRLLNKEIISSEKTQKIYCKEINLILTELKNITRELRGNNIEKNIEINTINYVIKTIQTIRKQINEMLELHDLNVSKLAPKINKREKLIDMLKKVDNQDDLMLFFKKKASNISSSKNPIFLKILIRKFNKFKSSITWTKININRVNKIEHKLVQIDDSYTKSVLLREQIEGTNLIQQSNNTLTKEEKEVLIKLNIENIKKHSCPAQLMGQLNSTIRLEIHKDKRIIQTLKVQLEKFLQKTKEISPSSFRTAQRIFFLTGVETNIFQTNNYLKKRKKEIDRLNEKITYDHQITIHEKKIFIYISMNYKQARGLLRHHYEGIELDIYIPGLKLNIESDGTQHDHGFKKKKDKIRDEALNRAGIKVLRIKNKANIYKEIDKYFIEVLNLKKQHKDLPIKNNDKIKDISKKNKELKTKLMKIKNIKKLKLFCTTESGNISKIGDINLLYSIVKKFNSLKEQIKWDDFYITFIDNIENKIKQNNSNYNLPKELKYYIKK